MAPSVEPEQRSYLAIEYVPQELTCSAMGVPSPTISFLINGVVLDRVGNSSNTSGDISERVNLREQSQPILNDDLLYTVTRTLVILYPIGDDTDHYNCVASFEVLNQTLTAEATFDLVVQSKIYRPLLLSQYTSIVITYTL